MTLLMYKVNGNFLPILDDGSDSGVLFRPTLGQKGVQLTSMLEECEIELVDAYVPYSVVSQIDDLNADVFIGISTDFDIHMRLDSPVGLTLTDEHLSEFEESEREVYEDEVLNSPELEVSATVSMLVHYRLEESHGQLVMVEDATIADAALQDISITLDSRIKVEGRMSYLRQYNEADEVATTIKNQLQFGLMNKPLFDIQVELVDIDSQKHQMLYNVMNKYSDMKQSIQSSFKKNDTLGAYTQADTYASRLLRSTNR